MKGQLGILVTTDKYLEHIIGIARAAAKSQRRVSIFLMDDGVLLLKNPAFCALQEEKRIELTACLHSVESLMIKEREKGVEYAGQFLNAQIAHDCQRYLVF